MEVRRGVSTVLLCAVWALALLTVGVLLSGSQAQARPLGVGDVPQDTGTPTRTPTMLPTSMPNLWGGTSWVNSCSPPVLNITTYSNSIPGTRCIGASVMRLTNSHGEYVERSVPSLCDVVYQSYSISIAFGNSVPYEWVYAYPYTLTVDYNNQVIEFNEGDNLAYAGMAPCAIGTGTPSVEPTGSPTNTPTILAPSPTATGFGNCVISVTSAVSSCQAPDSF